MSQPEVKKRLVNTFDLDGVIYLGHWGGVYPGPNDIILTGRSFEEAKETYDMLSVKGISNQVFFNQVRFNQKNRVNSGIHKGKTLLWLKSYLSKVAELGVHFEDDEIQVAEILKIVPHQKIVLLKHCLTEKENRRHDDWAKQI